MEVIEDTNRKLAAAGFREEAALLIEWLQDVA
jgi:hypothetical protein